MLSIVINRAVSSAIHNAAKALPAIEALEESLIPPPRNQGLQNKN